MTSIAGTPYLEIIAYDILGRPSSQRDAAGYTLTSHYSTAGYVQSLSDSRINGTVYEMLSMNARGQALQDRRGANANLLGTMSYDAPTGRPLAVCAGAACALQDLSYSFDKVGNLTQRARAISTQPTIEAASYDALNRLTAAALTEIQGVVQIPPAVTTSVGYDKLGNVCNNSGINLVAASSPNASRSSWLRASSSCSTHDENHIKQLHVVLHWMPCQSHQAVSR